jgi:hypothetical protein
MNSYNEDEVRRRVQREVDDLSDVELSRMKRSKSSLESWIYRVAYQIGRILTAPIRWIINLIEGFFEGFFS